jgi:hypothetical protein
MDGWGLKWRKGRKGRERREGEGRVVEWKEEKATDRKGERGAMVRHRLGRGRAGKDGEEGW